VSLKTVILSMLMWLCWNWTVCSD